MSGPESIQSLEEFLIHAYVLENESVDRYEELAQNMEDHHNPEVAALFRKMAEYGRKHAAEVARYARGKALPSLRPWEFKWPGNEGPETGDYAQTSYLMTTQQALRFALGNERRGYEFYQAVADKSPTAKVREMADEFAREESEHVRLLEQWIARTPESPIGWDFDPDPPNAPG